MKHQSFNSKTILPLSFQPARRLTGVYLRGDAELIINPKGAPQRPIRPEGPGEYVAEAFDVVTEKVTGVVVD